MKIIQLYDLYTFVGLIMPDIFCQKIKLAWNIFQPISLPGSVLCY